MASTFLRSLYHTQRRTTVGRTPLDESSQRPLPYNTQHSQQTNIHASGGIRTHDLCRRAAADLRLRPRGHCDRRQNHYQSYLVHQPTYILNETQIMADISLLLVSAPGCHPQGLFQIKVIQASPSLE